jgi:pimeloyl-ACP methyl ester carboxylesterase
MPTLPFDTSPPLDATARAKAPGQFLDLPDGKVHYRWDGPENGPVVVMIHGISLHHVAFDHNVPALVAAGFRVLRMDNYGRGWSDRPHKANDVELFDRLYVDALDALGLRQPVTLVGYSMGGAIAIAFAARHPERVNRLALIAPAGLPFERPRIARYLQIPGVGECLMRLFGHDNTLNGIAELLESRPALRDEYVAKLAATIDYRGYYGALLSTLRHYPLNALQEEWAQVGRHARPTLIVWGDRDATVAFPGAEAITRLMPNARLKVYPGQGHGIPMLNADALNADLIGFLNR